MEHKASNTDNPFAPFFTTEKIELSQVFLQLAYPISLLEHRCNVLKDSWDRNRKKSIPSSEPVNSSNTTATATTSPHAAY
jgi:hypothetical protein